MEIQYLHCFCHYSVWPSLSSDTNSLWPGDPIWSSFIQETLMMMNFTSIAWTSAYLPLISQRGTTLGEILCESCTFSLKEIHEKITSLVQLIMIDEKPKLIPT